MHIYNIILIAYLKPAINLVEDPYYYRYLPTPPIIINRDVKYEIKWLL